MNFHKFLLIAIGFLLALFWSSKAEASVLTRAPNSLGLVGYWSLNDGAGATATDFSGNKNNGTLTNMDPSTDWVNGRHGKALNFDGSDDFVTMGDVLDFERTDSFSVSFWVRQSVFSFTAMVSKIDSANDFRGWMVYNNTGGDVNFILRSDNDPSNSLEMEADQVLSLNTWHYVVTTYDGSSAPSGVKIYTDGISRSLTTISNSLSATTVTSVPFNIGARNNGSIPFNGLIDDVRIYNRALTAAEVSALYRAGEVRQRNPNNLGLVGYWSMNDGATATTTDSSGLGNHGALVNMDPSTDWVNGRHGKALDFDGSNDYVDMPRGVVDVSRPFTFSAWVNPSSTANNDIGIVSKWASGNGAVIYGDGFGPEDSIDFHLTTTAISSLAGLVIGRWYHAAGTYDGTTGRLYLDGVFQNSAVVTIVDPATQLQIGTYSNNAGGNWNGLIDEVRVYNRALSAAEVSALYRAGEVRQRNPNNLGLVGYWSMNDGAGATATDLSGNKNNGTLTNMDPSTDWVNGRHGKALDFDGVDDAVTRSVVTTATNNITLSAWVKWNGSTSQNRFIINNGNSGSSGYGLMAVYTGNANNITILNGGSGFANSNLKLAVGRWQHTVAIRDAGTWKLYLDNIQQSLTGNPTPATPVGSTVIGNTQGGAESFDGLIDEVRIYNRALSAAEVKALYESR